jgi:hypothetical protein
MKDKKKASLKATIFRLKDMGVEVVQHEGPDQQHFGDWLVIGRDRNVIVRFVCDRDHIGLDLMPAHLFKGLEVNSESDWYTWDVVASAANLPFKVELEPLPWFFSYRGGVNRAFAPENWDEIRRRLADAEQEKRRRFTDGPRVRERVHA